MVLPACQQCDNTEYEERAGHYYCTVCNQQSQELGRVTVVDPDSVMSQGMTFKKSVSLSGSSRRKSKSLKAGTALPTERWSKAEGFSQILNTWCSQLEKLGIENIRRPVLDVWAVYLRTIGAAFTVLNEKKLGEDQRCVSRMSYRDKWNYLNGPRRVKEPYFIKGKVLRRERIAERKRKLEEAESSQAEDPDLPEEEVKKRRRKHKRKFYKSFSESLRGDSDTDVGGLSSGKEEEEESLHSKSDSEAHKSPTSDTENWNIDDESDLASEILSTTTAKTKTPADLTLKYVRAVFVIGVTGIPGTPVTTSDLAVLFSRDYLPWVTSIQSLPKNYRPISNERHSYMGAGGSREGIQFIKESVLRKEASELLNYLKIGKLRKLTLCIPMTFESVLERYLQDFCLPGLLLKDMIKTFSRCDLMTLNVVQGKNKKFGKFPCVSVRVLGLLLVVLKYHFGLDDVQEYYLSNLVQAYEKSGNVNDPSQDIFATQNSAAMFDFITWLRLSKLRLDYLISNDFTIREQFRRFRHVGVPETTVESMNEPQKILGKRLFLTTPTAPLYRELREILDQLGDPELTPRHPNETLKYFEECTTVLLNENSDPNLRTQLGRLSEMKHHSMDVYFASNRIREKLDLPENLLRVTERLDRKFHNGSIKCPTVPSSGLPQVNPSEREEVDWKDIVPAKRYWFSPFTVCQPRPCKTFYFKRAQCDEDFWSHIQFLPENYLWLLNYMSCYAAVPLYLLEKEVQYLEQYILKLEPGFFGSASKFTYQKSPKKAGPKPKNTNTTDFEYCDCSYCQDIDEYFPKESDKIF